MSSVNVRSARLLLRALRNPNEHFRSGRKLWTRFEILSVISAVCVRRTCDEGFEKPVDNYGVSSSSRGTLKEKQGWRWAARAEPTKAVRSPRPWQWRQSSARIFQRSTIGSRIETRKCRNSSLPYFRTRADWGLYHQIRRYDFFLFLFLQGNIAWWSDAVMMWLPFIELCREFRVIKFSRS